MSRKNFLFNLLISASLAVILAGCGKFSYRDGKSGEVPTINVTVGGVRTKAPVTTTARLQDTMKVFHMDAYVTADWKDDVIGNRGPHDAGLYFSKDVNYAPATYKWGSCQWVIDGNASDTPQWCWVNKTAINFFSYAPATPNGTRNIGTAATPFTTLPFTYQAPSSPTSQTCDDLIFAYTTQTASYADEGIDPQTPGTLISGAGTDKVNVTFYHALSQIRFCLSSGENSDGTFPATLKLVSVKIKDLVAKGSCNFTGPSTFDWTLSTSDSDKADYTQTFNVQFGQIDSETSKEIIPEYWYKTTYTKDSATYPLYVCAGDVLFVLPQDPKGKELEITLQIGTETPFTVTAFLAGVDASDDTKIWEPGKYYTYKIKAFKTVTVELIANDWVDGGSEITI